MSEDGAAVNAVSLAEICVGDAEPESVADRIRSWGVTLLDVPAAAAGPCAKAYHEYRERPLATADEGRFRTYFPTVTLLTP